MSLYAQEVKGEVEGLEVVLGQYEDLFSGTTDLPPQRRCG